MTAMAASLFPRGPQTNATCLNEFSWMDNESGLSACLVAAYVMSSCGSGNFAVLSLVDGAHYDEPGKGENAVTSCSCSWAGYNMLAACTACQGFEDSIFGWAPWKQQCDNDHLSETTYFPFNEDFTLDTTLPFWAGQDPLSWKSGRFDPVQARTLANEGHNDLSGTEPSANPDDNSSSTPVGPIVGGVIGGLVVIGLAAFAAWWLVRRHRRLTERTKGATYSMPKHDRSPSDFTNGSTYGGISMIHSSPPVSPAPQMDARSYFGSVHGSSVLMSPVSSPAPTAMNPYVSAYPQQPMEPQDVIVPFTATAARPSSPPTDRKDRISFNVYDSSSSPSRGPVEESISSHGSTPSRRLNPPAYTPPAYPAIQQRIEDTFSSGSQTPEMGHRSGKESVDSTLTWTSSPGMSVRNPSAEPTSSRNVDEFGNRITASTDTANLAKGVDRSSSPSQTVSASDGDFDPSSRLA